MRNFSLTVLKAALFGSLVFFNVVPAVATVVVPQLSGAAFEQAEMQREEIFLRMMMNPTDVGLALEYAGLSVQVGDLEGAISTLERMAFFAPESSRIKLDLGILYFRLGANQVAASYFEAAANSADATPELGEHAAKYLAAIDRQSSAGNFSASISFGAQYQSNANGGVADRSVSLNGITFQLSTSALARADANAFVSGQMRYLHDLNAEGDALEFRLAGIGTVYANSSEINALHIEGRVGPSFDLGRFEIDDATLSLYGLLSASVLEGSLYSYTAGVGVSVAKDLNVQTQAKLDLEYRYATLVNSTSRPNIANGSGPRARVAGSLEHQVDNRVSVYSGIFAERTGAEVGHKSNWAAGGSVGASMSFDAPAFNTGPWTVSLSGGVTRRVYDSADPAVSATLNRQDWEGFAQLALYVPLAEGWSAQTSLGYRRVWSNYQLSDFDNISASVSLTKNF